MRETTVGTTSPVRDACEGVLHELRHLIADPAGPARVSEERIRTAMRRLDAAVSEGGQRADASDLRAQLGSLFDYVGRPGELVIAATDVVRVARQVRDAS